MYARGANRFKGATHVVLVLRLILLMGVGLIKDYLRFKGKSKTQWGMWGLFHVKHLTEKLENVVFLR